MPNKKGQLMSKVKENVIQVLTCPECYGQGFTGWSSPDGDFDFDYCECNPTQIPAETIADFHQLFKNWENN